MTTLTEADVEEVALEWLVELGWDTQMPGLMSGEARE